MVLRSFVQLARVLYTKIPEHFDDLGLSLRTIKTDFIPVTLKGSTTIIGSKLLSKGSPILIWGSIQVRNYESLGFHDFLQACRTVIDAMLCHGDQDLCSN